MIDWQLLSLILLALLPLANVIGYGGCTGSNCPPCGGGDEPDPDPCTDCTDGFDRPDGEDIDTDSDCGWVKVVDENITIASGKLRMEGGFGGALVLSNTVGTSEVRVNVLMASSGFGDPSNRARIIFMYEDSTHFYFWEFRGTTVKLFRRNGFSDTEITSVSWTPPASNVFATVSMCHANNEVSLLVTGASFAVLAEASASVTNPVGDNVVGLGTGNMNIGANVTWDDFQIVCGPCNFLIGGDCGTFCVFDLEDESLAFAVDLGAGGLSDNTCERCDEILGEWTVPGPSVACFWSMGIGADGACAPGVWGIAVFIQSFEGKCYMVVTVSLAFGESEASERRYAQYEIAETEPGMLPGETSWTLTKSPGHTNPYRGFSVWQPTGEDWGGRCDGGLPATITVRLTSV